VGVKGGYKLTEAGLIPEDWESTKLGDGCDLITKGTTPTSVGRAFLKAGVRFLKAETLSEAGRVIPDKLAFIDDATHTLLARSQLTAGDLLVSIAGVLGRVGMVSVEDTPANINQALAVVRLRKRSVFEAHYLFHALRGQLISKQIRDINVQAAQANISLYDVRNFRVPLPPTRVEQEAIAETLNDADALIESLEQLIAKKRQIKQGAMHELLTSKTRLQGFNGKWEGTCLGSVAQRIVGGGTPARGVPAYWNGSLPWMTVKDFAGHSPTGTLEFISHDGLENSATNLIPAGTLIASTRMALGKAVIFEVDVCINQDLKAIFLRQDTDTRFAFYWFEFNALRVAEMGSGSTVMGVSLSALRGIAFAKPPRAEQVAIAAVLTDMDAEVDALEGKLEKTRLIKQGMMQELLTGRIRLA
jgi:type I restriction enzyme, S subunit